jgi:hypothetical protein
MLIWLRVYASPVADIFAKFFAELRPCPAELIARHIRTQSQSLRNRILVDILGAWPREAVAPLKHDLTMLATHPGVLNNDIECFKLILKHDFADREWVRAWMSSRKKQAAERARLFEELEMQYFGR